jgi:hypothetical protein
MKSIAFYSILLFALLITKSAMANDVCEDYCDYICRHYKTDLRPTGFGLATFQRGSIGYQTVKLKIRNSGDQDFGQSGSTKIVKIFLGNGLGYRDVSIQGVLPKGESRWFKLGSLKNSTLRHCQKIKVRIDVNKDIGQWGCGVFTNDTQILSVLQSFPRSPCRS